MRNLWIAITLLCLFSIPLRAQDYPRVEFYGGYQLLLDEEFMTDENWDFDQGTYLNGFTAAGEINVKSFFGIVGEVGYGKTTYYNYDGGVLIHRSQTTLLAGPRFGYRGGRVRIFGHALAGFNREVGGFDYAYYYNYSERIEMNNFAFALGGGLDISLADRISIRPFQLDVIATHYKDTYGSGYQSQLRYSGGISIKLGGVAR